MDVNPYEAPLANNPPPKRDHSLAISIVVFLIAAAILALIVIPVGVKA